MRLTVDTPEDFTVIKIIFDKLYKEKNIFITRHCPIP